MLNGLEGLLLPFTIPYLGILIAAGTFAGIYIGAIPGLSVTMAVSLLISFTFSWDTLSALALMIGVFVGGVYGGARSAILLNIPGAPAAIATALDGYPLAKKGLAGETIGIATVQSVIGGLIGVLIMVTATPLMSKIALGFAPRDYFLIGIMGILLVGSMGSKSTAKGVFTGVLGVLIGLIGMDPFTGIGRFTFGNLNLLGGISYVAAMIGLFGVSEALYQIRDIDRPMVKQEVTKIIPSWNVIYKFIPLTIRSSIIGGIIGALPGTGGDIAAILAYDNARRTVKNNKVEFGEGAIEGVIAPETANNAAIGGAFIPMLTLGIPGDSVTAIIIGAMFIHGLRPGPLLILDNPSIFWFIVISLIVANVFLLIFGLMGIKLFTRIVEIPREKILPSILVLSAIGAYSISGSYFELLIVIIFGVIGYVFRVYNFPIGPIVLGMILGPIIDSNFRRAILSSGSIVGFIVELFTNPISFVLLAIIVYFLVYSYIQKRRI